VRTVNTDTVLLYINNNVVPEGRVSRIVARSWRNAGLASFFDKGRAIRVHNVRSLLRRPKTVGTCKQCGGGSFQRLCASCRRHSSQEDHQ
jgi:hypothetical protein